MDTTPRTKPISGHVCAVCARNVPEVDPEGVCIDCRLVIEGQVTKRLTEILDEHARRARRRAEAVLWIESHDTKQARTLQEKAKYMVASTLPADLPHPKVWWEVLGIARMGEAQ